ncbi:hypothetical protein ASD64_18365 [Mesorhizobium sp. Root157]|uniref:KGG domain-containing protein n=1 Tax=Mesorhizobium sp. Root157 TaxID=1736477 RepID=UPI0006FE8D43|nr:KGG domain-containing protein [Mesorhizobium sp. Root157]KQZ95872.1 hypothetical protein ASD64_18365 [Mesorhizobium sp. Root157]
MPNRGENHEPREKSGQRDHKNEGGQRSQQHAQDDKKKQSGGERGGNGNFKNDPERASEAGRKGGQS